MVEATASRHQQVNSLAMKAWHCARHALEMCVVAFNMTVPMAAWMRFRGMAFRPILEMSAAMVAEAIIILIAYWFGAVENVAAGRATTLWAWQHGLMVPAMLVPMFMRLDM